METEFTKIELEIVAWAIRNERWLLEQKLLREDFEPYWPIVGERLAVVKSILSKAEAQTKRLG